MNTSVCVGSAVCGAEKKWKQTEAYEEAPTILANAAAHRGYSDDSPSQCPRLLLLHYLDSPEVYLRVYPVQKVNVAYAAARRVSIGGILADWRWCQRKGEGQNSVCGVYDGGRRRSC